MLEELKAKVCKANLELRNQNLVILTWGNVSEIDRDTNLVVIKPSGISYDEMKPSDMVVIDLDGNVVEGRFKPSSDTPTHLELYKEHKEIGSVVHTHSFCATAWAQTGRNLDCFGTTHADTFHGPVLVTRDLTKEEIEKDYEKNTGVVINEIIKDKDPFESPGIFVKNHGPFTWGRDSIEAVHNAVVLEYISGLAINTLSISPEKVEICREIQDKHYFRKHGKNAYYGQK